ncbi:MAG: dicarboxylate/amino acid:cation symporter [Aestuariibacter sp.]|nr:dicarboxylate/amino acid:cation symporter [Aestuariibacter sp.]|tara:strand:+ start:86929 stop:88221 length:1293 start_codon:yes stop_codon:yes gene_type:complete
MSGIQIRGNLTAQILIALLAAVVVGVFLQATGLAAEGSVFRTYILDGLFYVGGQGFIGLMKMMVIPLVFLGIMLAVADNDDVGQAGRMGVKAMASYVLTTVIAITLGLALALAFGVGEGVNAEVTGKTVEVVQAPPMVETFLNMIPANPIQSMVEGNMIAVMVFAVFIGIAVLGHAAATGNQNVKNLAKDANDITLSVVKTVMGLAPYGLFMMMTKTIADKGVDALAPLMGYFFVVVAALAIQMLVVYPAYMAVFARINPINFFKKMPQVWLFGFSTASSSATIPVTQRVLEKGMGVCKSVTSFNVPLGATLNMDGTSIMQGVATIFVAQAFGITLTFEQLGMVVLTATLASMGTAAVRGAGTVTLVMVFSQVGLPVEGILMIMAVDAILDMIRTAVNLTGDSAVTMVVAHSEGKLDRDVYNDPNATAKA